MVHLPDGHTVFFGIVARVLQRDTLAPYMFVIYRDISVIIKRFFFQAESVLEYGCTTLTLTKRTKEKQDGNYGRTLRAVLNKSWK